MLEYYDNTQYTFDKIWNLQFSQMEIDSKVSLDMVKVQVAEKGTGAPSLCQFCCFTSTCSFLVLWRIFAENIISFSKEYQNACFVFVFIRVKIC